MSVESLCRELRKDPFDPDIVRKLKRIWELLVEYDETGDESCLGKITTMEVGYEMMYVAGKIEMKDLERFVGRTSGMLELLFQWDFRSRGAIASQRLEYLGEEQSEDPEYEKYGGNVPQEAMQQFVPYITTILASCAGLQSIQLKAVSRLIDLTLDPVVWHSCPLGLEVASVTLAAMANPASSFRDEFLRMGGLACVGLVYLETEEDERLNVVQQMLSRVRPEEFKTLMTEQGMRQLTRTLITNCYDLDCEDRHTLVAETFARMWDTKLFQDHVEEWAKESFWRKDCPSGFLKFVLKKSSDVLARFPHISRHDQGLLLASAWEANEALRRGYAWSVFPESRKRVWRLSASGEANVQKAEEMQMLLGTEEVDWDTPVIDKGLKVDNCMRCGLQGVKLLKCGKCKLKWYCSQKCQASDWTQYKHKEYCGK